MILVFSAFNKVSILKGLEGLWGIKRWDKCFGWERPSGGNCGVWIKFLGEEWRDINILGKMGGRIGLWMDGIEKRCMDFYGHNDGLRMVSWDGWDLSGGYSVWRLGKARSI